MSAIISWVLGNPLIILSLIGMFTFTSIFSEAKAWLAERHAVTAAVQPWIKAVAERDAAAAQKEDILNRANEARVVAEQSINELQAQFDEEDAKRKLTAAADCAWSDDDIRLLNAATGRKARTPAR
jgi:hypothetical protein